MVLAGNISSPNISGRICVGDFCEIASLQLGTRKWVPKMGSQSGPSSVILSIEVLGDDARGTIRGWLIP